MTIVRRLWWLETADQLHKAARCQSQTNRPASRDKTHHLPSTRLGKVDADPQGTHVNGWDGAVALGLESAGAQNRDCFFSLLVRLAACGMATEQHVYLIYPITCVQGHVAQHCARMIRQNCSMPPVPQLAYSPYLMGVRDMDMRTFL